MRGYGWVWVVDYVRVGSELVVVRCDFMVLNCAAFYLDCYWID